MSINDVQELVNKLSKSISSNQKLATPFLVNKLAKAAELYPDDKTVGMIFRVLSNMENSKTFIKRSELKSLYHKYHSFGTKFAELFEEELDEKPYSDQNFVTENQVSNPGQISYQVQDQVLVNALEHVFDNTLPIKAYSQPLANQALRSVNNTLNAWDLVPNQLNIENGNDHFIVIKADYETPKGLTSFYVPVEIKKDNILSPEVFMGNIGPEDLNYVSIKNYLTKQAGSKSKITSKDILNILTEASVQKREISDAEIAVTKLHVSRQGQDVSGILGIKVEAEVRPDVELPKSDEFISFEKEFTSPKGLAAYQFGSEKVNIARNLIIRELASFGFIKPQVVITASDKESINFGVSLDTGKTAFTVPVKIIKGNIQKPTIMLCNGSICDFDRAGINSLVSDNKTDIKIVAVASVMGDLKPSEVINNLRQALADDNHIKAEDALNVLANCGDQKAFETGFQIFLNGMNGKKVEKSACSKIITSSVSEKPICSHTGLTLDKVYQDKNGFCLPIYRRGMDETYEAASFISAKIFQ